MVCEKEQCGEFTIVRIENDAGLFVELLSFGACLKRVSVPIAGTLQDISLSFEEIEEYTVRSTGNAGKTLAPNAGEVGEEPGIVLTDGSEIHPAANRNGNSLHGGAHAGNLQNWTLIECKADETHAYAVFALALAAGLDGWSGNRKFTVRYTVDQNSTIEIDLSAETDRKTYINMSNHAYWNLERDPANAMEQRLTLDVAAMCYNDAHSLPSCVVPCEKILQENGIDFTEKNRIGDFLQSTTDDYGKQIEMGGGIDNAFLLRSKRNPEMPACILENSNGSIKLELYTDAPAVVVYQAGGMKPGIRLRNGFLTTKNCAIALEAQDIPNLSPVKPLAPGEEFKRKICYKLFWQ